MESLFVAPLALLWIGAASAELVHSPAPATAIDNSNRLSTARDREEVPSQPAVRRLFGATLENLQKPKTPHPQITRCRL